MKIRHITEKDYERYDELLTALSNYIIHHTINTYKTSAKISKTYKSVISEREFKKNLQEDIMFCAVINNRIVGVISMCLMEVDINDKAPYIFRLYVDEKYRNRGIATALLDKCVETAKTGMHFSYNKILINVDVWNKDALSLYKKYGFNEKAIDMEMNI